MGHFSVCTGVGLSGLWIVGSLLCGGVWGLLPSMTSATFKPGKEVRGRTMLEFDGDQDLWFDFSEVDVDDGLPQPPKLSGRNSQGSVCINGSWLGYKQPNLVSKGIGGVQLISGYNNCVDLKKLGINSMQPVSPSVFRLESIALFTEKVFGSIATVLSPVKTKIVKVKREWVPQIKSFILSGTLPMTVVDTLGKVLCLVPKTKLKNPICFVPDVAQFGLSYSSPFAGIIKGCNSKKKGYNKTVEITNCKEFGGGTSALDMPAWDKGKDVVVGMRDLEAADECPEQPDYFNDRAPDLKLLKELLSVRLEHDFFAPDQLLWFKTVDNVWKMGVGDGVFDLVYEICPAELVNPLFMAMVREFFVFHLDQVWEGKRKELVDTSLEIGRVVERLQHCLVIAKRYSLSMRVGVLHTFQILRNTKKLESTLNHRLDMNRTNDPIIEVAWVVSNLAYGMCHHFLEYRMDFYTDFLLAVGNLYFAPLAERWLTPKIPPSTFRHVLGGFGFDDQYVKLQHCASTALRLTHNFEPFGREFK